MHTFSISPYEDLTLRGGVLHDLSSVEIILGNFGPPWTNLIRRKKIKRKAPEVRPRDGHTEHVCKISGAYLLKRA